MESIFAVLSVEQLIMILIALILAIVGILKAVDYIWDKIRKKIDKEYKAKQEHDIFLDKLAAHQQQCNAGHEHVKVLQGEFENFKADVGDKMETQDKKIDLLIRSDRNDIKGWIVREYHYFTEQKGWIDDFSMEAIERRFEDYTEEGGNSYVQDLVNKIRDLPRHPPEDQDLSRR